MRVPNWATDKTRRGVTNRLLVASLVLSVPAFFWTERRLRTVTPFCALTLPFDAASVRFAPDNAAIVVNSQGGSRYAQDWIAVYDFPSLRERWTARVVDASDVRFSADGKRVLLENYAVAMAWDTRSGFLVAAENSRRHRLIDTVETGTVGRHYRVYRLGEGEDKKWLLQDTHGGEPVFLQNADEPGWRSAIFTPDERHLIAVNSENSSIRCWRTADGKLLPVPRTWRDLKPVALYPTPDNKLVALCRDNTVKENDFSLAASEPTAPVRTLSAGTADLLHFGILSDSGRFLHVIGSRVYSDGLRIPESTHADMRKMIFAADPAVRDEKVEQIIDRHTGKVRTFTAWGGETRFEMLGDSGWAYTYPGWVRPLGETPRQTPFASWLAERTRPSPRLHDLHSGEEWFLPDVVLAYTARTSEDGRVMVTRRGARLEFWKLPRRRKP